MSRLTLRFAPHVSDATKADILRALRQLKAMPSAESDGTVFTFTTQPLPRSKTTRTRPGVPRVMSDREWAKRYRAAMLRTAYTLPARVRTPAQLELDRQAWDRACAAWNESSQATRRFRDTNVRRRTVSVALPRSTGERP